MAWNRASADPLSPKSKLGFVDPNGTVVALLRPLPVPPFLRQLRFILVGEHLGIEGAGALRADAMGKARIRVFVEVLLDLLPVALIIPDTFARMTL